MIPRPADPAGPLAVRDAVQATARTLREAHIDEADVLAEWTVAALLGIGRADLRANGNRTINATTRAQLDAATARLADDEPLQYVLGHVDFLGRRFACDRRALIPRPETEELALAALRIALPDPAAEAHVADIGTGTGCLAISLALERPHIRVLATDLSADALSLAAGNARAHGVDRRIRFVCADLLGNPPPGTLDAVISNPPYIGRAEIETLDRRVRDFEPRLALDGGPDGLDVIRRLAPEAGAALRPGGHLLLEIGDTQGPDVRTILAHAGFSDIAILPDLSGRNRIAMGRSPSTGF